MPIFTVTLSLPNAAVTPVTEGFGVLTEHVTLWPDVGWVISHPAKTVPEKPRLIRLVRSVLQQFTEEIFCFFIPYPRQTRQLCLICVKDSKKIIRWWESTGGICVA